LGPDYWSWYAFRILHPINSGENKSIGFTADSPASKCIGFTADFVARECIGFTAVDAECVSASTNRPDQHIGFPADASSAKFGYTDTTNDSYGNPCFKVTPPSQS
jgi:hypothetical protein